MDIVAHGLWAAAGGLGAKRAGWKFHIAWLTWWAMFPDVLAFGPMVAVGLWMLLRGAPAYPHFRAGLPLYPLGHSLVTFAVVYGLATLALRRPPIALLGWLSHISIDIFTHSHRYYATPFLWPLWNYRFNGIPWWTPWFWVSTYVALAIVYALLWKAGWLQRAAKPAAQRAKEPV
jgi:hypothetical protein